MHRSLFAVNIIFFFSSCYSPRYVYSPVTQNIPLVSKKNDLKVAAYFSSGLGSNDLQVYKKGSNLGLDIQGAYAFTNKVAVILNYYNRWEKNGVDNDIVVGDSIGIKYKRNLIEVGLGYYSILNNTNIAFQVFGGIGIGKFTIKETIAQNRTSSGRFHNSDVTILFIQPAIISGFIKNFTAGFSSRFSAIFYNNIMTDYTDSELKQYFLSELSHSPVFFWEPAMDYTYGPKKLPGIRLEMQLGFSILLNSRFVDYRTMNMALGITSDLAFKRHASKTSKTNTRTGVN